MPIHPDPLPCIIDLVDVTSGYEKLLFLDAFSEYNQIPLYKPDQEHTTFITNHGMYCYRVMPFGLKNAGATYQMLVNTVFTDLIGKKVEAYIDDIVVKTSESQNHIQDLQVVLDRVLKYNMKLNPMKCSSGLTFGKF